MQRHVRRMQLAEILSEQNKAFEKILSEQNKEFAEIQEENKKDLKKRRICAEQVCMHSLPLLRQHRLIGDDIKTEEDKEFDKLITLKKEYNKRHWGFLSLINSLLINEERDRQEIDRYYSGIFEHNRNLMIFSMTLLISKESSENIIIIPMYLQELKTEESYFRLELEYSQTNEFEYLMDNFQYYMPIQCKITNPVLIEMCEDEVKK